MHTIESGKLHTGSVGEPLPFITNSLKKGLPAPVPYIFLNRLWLRLFLKRPDSPTQVIKKSHDISTIILQ